MSSYNLFGVPQGSFSGLLENNSQTQLIDPKLMPTVPDGNFSPVNYIIRARRSGDRLLVDVNTNMAFSLDNAVPARIKLPPGLHLNRSLYPTRDLTALSVANTYTFPVGIYYVITNNSVPNIFDTEPMGPNRSAGVVYIDVRDAGHVYFGTRIQSLEITPDSFAANFVGSASLPVSFSFDIPIAEWAV